MQTKIRRIDLMEPGQEDSQAIDQVLRRSPDSTVFHTPEWNRLLMRHFGLRNVTLLASVGQAPVGLYSYYVLDDHLCRSPAIHLQSVYGGPLSTVNRPQVVADLLKEAERLQRTALFQVWTPPNYDASVFVRLGYSIGSMCTPVLHLDASEEELWARLDRKKRGAIRRAIKHGVGIAEGDISALDEYHEMVTATLGRARIKALPKSFYAGILERLVPQGMARLVLARHAGTTIAGTFFLLFKETVSVWDMGWRRDYPPLAPNDLLNWEVIKWASQKGFKNYDFLRFDPDHLSGIALWKKTWGVELVPCYYVSKVTPGLRLLRGLKVMTNPGRAFRKLRTWTSGRCAPIPGETAT
ncbi:MAG: GNAT family N-acetyltransferase [Chloroflexi bacterium]|nr:GNAT family N-acetyltransferase [Chloroflexota bacterium]